MKKPKPQTDGGEYCRAYYGVPAYPSTRVIADGKPGVITGFDGQYIMVQLDGENHSGKWHPTWHMDYPEPEECVPVPSH